jgi:hypothetical protein
MGLICNTIDGRRALCRNGVDRYVPAYWTLEAAIAELADAERGPRYRRRAPAELPVLNGIASTVAS